ncbi:MAG: hypothetical protein KDB58_10355 [Solirubrobacterales bacterium]|nr:hypothetical protein [Solirubrobacterales bacterium]
MEGSKTSGRSGWATFAGVMFIIAGAANLIWGIAALDSKEYLPESGLLFSTLTLWGWIAILWGIVVLIGSYLLLSDSPSGPGAGVILATVSAVFWLFALPVLPIFAMTVILIDALIIYGLLQPDPSS